ncbi:MAG: phosphodiester glycosidase family protein [Verrucomicrobiia bacterium]
MRTCGLLTVMSLAVVAACATETLDETVSIEGVEYRRFVADPAQVRVYWSDPSGKAFRQFVTLVPYLEAKGEQVQMITNGGIFEPQGIPAGLLVQDGRQIRPLNVGSGKGNFYLKPNGVFFVARGVAGARFSSARLQPEWAVQSGPLLLENGKVHPQFRTGSESRLHRNGVGIRSDGKVVFLITRFESNRKPNLYEFAAAFKEHGCQNALFLDGDLSDMRVSPLDQIKPGNFFGSLIVVMKKQQTPPGNPSKR